MMRRLLMSLLIALPPTLAAAQDNERALTMPEVPQLTVTLRPADAVVDGVYLHGQLVLGVQVASRYPFEELDLTLPEIPNAQVIRLQRPRTERVRSYAGDGYVFETALAIFPNQSGPLEIPGVEVRGAVSPRSGDERPFADRSADLRLDVLGIDDSYADSWWLVSDRIEISETWSKPLEELRVHDIVRREVTVKAFAVTAERMPAIEHGRTRGVTVADVGVTSTTEVTRDGVIATVTQAWDLKIETNGVAYISPVNLAYWDPRERVRKKVAVSGKRIEPLPVDRAAVAERLLNDARDRHERDGLVAASLLGLVLFPFSVLGAVAFWLALPTPADRRLARDCARADATREIYAAVRRWADASGLSLTDMPAPDDYGHVVRAVFAEGTSPVDHVRLVKALTRHSRRQRLRGLGARIVGWLTWLLGPRTELDIGDASRPAGRRGA